MEDAGLCMEFGRVLPAQMRGAQSGDGEQGKGTLVGLLEIWIREFEQFEELSRALDMPQRKKSQKRHSLLGGTGRSEPLNPAIT